MNAAIDNVHPLPAALATAAGIDGRRHRIGAFDLDLESLEDFNHLLWVLDQGRPALRRDQLATAARELAELPAGRRAAPCISQRMRQAGAIDLMLGDRDWDMADESLAPAHLVVDYVRGASDLIPDGLPRVGRLDDAIVIDAGWRSLAVEVRDFLDFCRLRRLERLLNGGQPARFDRKDWVEARIAESRLAEHLREAMGRSYVPAPAERFMIH